MFDKFIESGSDAEKNTRRTYFLVSTIVVGILFITGVIASIYAQEIALGTDEFELGALLTPITPEVAKSEPDPRQQQPQSQRTDDDIPVRQAAIDRIADSTKIPETTSVVANTQKELPYGRVRFDNYDSLELGQPNSTSSGTDAVTGSTSRPATNVELAEDTTPPEPPPVVKAKPKPMVSKGPVNGYATSLPKPAYPAVARAINLTGDVSVQVLIDESGNVVSAKVVSGHPFFRQDAERAAWKAKFKPTYLGDSPVRVTGVITYRFSK